MLAAGKSLRAGLNPLVEFLRRHLYRMMPSGQENFCHILMPAGSEGYSDVRRNGSRFAASNGRVSREAARDLHYPERRRKPP
jgi:hypothetical protein